DLRGRALGAVLDCAAIVAARDHSTRSALARGQLRRGLDSRDRYASRPQARHDHVPFGEGMGDSLRSRARGCGAQAGRSVRHRFRGRIVSRAPRVEVHRAVRSELLSLYPACDGLVRSRGPRRHGRRSAASIHRRACAHHRRGNRSAVSDRAATGACRRAERRWTRCHVRATPVIAGSRFVPGRHGSFPAGGRRFPELALAAPSALRVGAGLWALARMAWIHLELLRYLVTDLAAHSHRWFTDYNPCQSPEPRAQSPQPRAQSPEPRAQSPEPTIHSSQPTAREMPNTSNNSSLSWSERDAAVVWHGFTQMSCYTQNAPVIVERAEGRELIDVEGRRYLDAISSLWLTTLGHRVPELDAAIREQLDRIAHSTLLGNGNRIVIELAEALAKVVPVDGAHFLFASDGASAVEQALKIAFQYWTNQGVRGRHAYRAFGDAYHGDTVGGLSLGGGGFGTDIFDPLRFNVLRAPSFSDADALETAAKMVEQQADVLAAVVVEPLVQGAAGMLIADPSRFPKLQEACRKTGVLLICDEVATGFGRTGTLFASEQCSLRPDLLCLGKGITGGYLPMSATVASDRVYRAF